MKRLKERFVNYLSHKVSLQHIKISYVLVLVYYIAANALRWPYPTRLAYLILTTYTAADNPEWLFILLLCIWIAVTVLSIMAVVSLFFNRMKRLSLFLCRFLQLWCIVDIMICLYGCFSNKRALSNNLTEAALDILFIFLISLGIYLKQGKMNSRRLKTETGDGDV